jgi:putative intracellular protease/amidase
MGSVLGTGYRTTTAFKGAIMSTILFAVTGSSTWAMRDGTMLPAGFWAEELIDPYAILTNAGFTVEVTTPGGKPAPLQEYSLHPSMTGSAERSAELRAALDHLAPVIKHPLDLGEVDPAGIDAVYIPGGTGPMEDLYHDPDLGRILSQLQKRGATIAAACHGTIGLLAARDAEGKWIFDGYEMTGYSDEEERQGGPGDAAPFTLESKLRAEGANYRSSAPWSQFVITDRNLISGQNSASAAEVARQLVERFSRA